MAASTREVYLLLRARDEASRVVRGFSSELMRSAAAAQAAALRAEAITKRQEAATLRAAGASRAQVAALMASAKAMDDEAKAIIESERHHRRFAQSLTAVAGGLETMGIGFMIAGGLMIGFLVHAAKEFAEYERQVALTRTQIDGFSASMTELGDIGIDIARRIPVAFEQIMPALFDIFSSTNANLAQSKILIEAFSKAAVAGQTDIQTAARGTIAIMNAYNIPLEEVNDVLDIQFELVRKGVGTYEEFASVFGRVIPAATRAGQSFETVAAMLAFMTRNGQSAAMASTSAARALEAFTHPKTVGRLEDMGIKVKDVHGNFVPLVEILTALRERILALPPAERVGALFELLKGAGGTIQARRFIEQILLREGDLENFRDLLLSMGNASGVMEDKFAEMADTSAAKMQLLSNRWMALKLAIGEAATPILLQIVEILGKMVEWFNNLDPSTKKIVTQFLIWGSVLAVVGGALLAFLGFIAALVAAFVMAGAEILIVVGVVAGLGAVFVGAAAAVTMLWKKSEAFRSGIMGMKKAILDFWHNAAEPAFIAIASFMRDRVLPAAKEVWKFMGESLGKAFGILAAMIQQTLIPVLKQAVKWYNENKASVDRALGVIITLAKWVGIVGGVLAAVFVVLLAGPVIATVTAFIAVIWAIVWAFTAVVDGVIAAARWLQKTWNTVWAAVSEWFKSTWNDISSFFTTAWNTLVGAIMAGLEFLRGIWEAFWSVFGGIIKGIWGVVVGIVELGMTIVNKVIQIGLYLLLELWNFVWGGIKEAAVLIWTSIVDFFTMSWNGLVALWSLIWSLVGDKVKSAWNSITGFLRSAWDGIASTARGIWSGFYNTIAYYMDIVWSKISSIWNTISGFFAGGANWLWDAGRAIIRGLINGIESKLAALKAKLKKAAQTVRDFWPFSPAKTGPLAGRGDLLYAGQEITKRLADGMLRESDVLATASARLARRINIDDQGNPIFGNPGQDGFAPVGLEANQVASSKVINNTYNIYTQEIDPKRNAAELGFLIDGRL